MDEMLNGDRKTGSSPLMCVFFILGSGEDVNHFFNDMEPLFPSIWHFMDFIVDLFNNQWLPITNKMGELCGSVLWLSFPEVFSIREILESFRCKGPCPSLKSFQ
uniref:Uncharacterized protein n=1 Tax=Nelumbo nucifera TaxID=4432 RepID=A0A822ZVJ7_NELNU|nr:TPA_asm: hypothetical protein HUJ06_017246 [Nelumbo nucifera]